VLIAFPVMLAVAMFFMPESPVYLVSKGRNKEAEKSLQWLRGPNYDVAKEVADLQEENEKRNQIGSVTLKEIATNAAYLKPLAVVVILMLLQQFSGINVVIFYTQKIFNDAGSDIDVGLSAFLVGLAQVLGTGIAVVIVERFGRKILLVVSDLLMCFSIFALGVFFYIDDHADEESCKATLVEGVEVR